jgi:hypothetical protein
MQFFKLLVDSCLAPPWRKNDHGLHFFLSFLFCFVLFSFNLFSSFLVSYLLFPKQPFTCHLSYVTMNPRTQQEIHKEIVKSSWWCLSVGYMSLIAEMYIDPWKSGAGWINSQIMYEWCRSY